MAFPFGNANAIVLHNEADAAVLRLGAQHDALLVAGVLPGVVEEIDECGCQRVVISDEQRKVRLDVRFEMAHRPKSALADRSDGVIRDLLWANRLELEGEL